MLNYFSCFKYRRYGDLNVDEAIAKSYSMLSFLIRVSRENNLTSVYCAHVRLHLEYSIVWYPNFSIIQL